MDARRQRSVKIPQQDSSPFGFILLRDKEMETAVSLIVQKNEKMVEKGAILLRNDCELSKPNVFYYESH